MIPLVLAPILGALAGTLGALTHPEPIVALAIGAPLFAAFTIWGVMYAIPARPEDRRGVLPRALFARQADDDASEAPMGEPHS